MTTQTGAPATARGTTGRRRTRRILGVVLAAVAPLIVYVIARAAGVHPQTPGRSGGVQDLGAVAVVSTALVVGLVGWLVLALLERFSARGTRVWTVLAVVVFVLSLGAPLFLPGPSGSQRLTLALMHVCVAATLIPALGYRADRVPG